MLDDRPVVQWYLHTLSWRAYYASIRSRPAVLPPGTAAAGKSRSIGRVARTTHANAIAVDVNHRCTKAGAADPGTIASCG